MVQIFNSTFKSSHFEFLDNCDVTQSIGLKVLNLRIKMNLRSAVELQLSGIIGVANNPGKQQIRIIGFFFGNRLHWHLSVETDFLQTTILGCIFIYVQLKH